MAAVPERSRAALNQFSTLPCFNVKWGARKQLAFVRYRGGDPSRSSPSPSPSRRYQHHYSSLSPPQHDEEDDDEEDDDEEEEEDDDGGIEAVREKLMHDLKTEVDLMKVKLLGPTSTPSATVNATAVVKETNVGGAGEEDVEGRPWNLRTRRAVCKGPVVGGGGEERERSATTEVRVTERVREREREKPRAKFSVSLSRKEIEDDFKAMTGARPPRRPTKRPKLVQKQVDMMFPGYWLTEVTADMYKVIEQPEGGKERKV